MAEAIELPQSEAIELPPLLRQILLNRGYDSEGELAAFLNPSYDEHLHDPFLLTDMAKAVARILAAVKVGQKIVIYGDYDIDGITASAVMLETIKNLGGEATSYIPDRFEEGYGINLEALQKLKEQGTDLVISVDCGITSVKEVEWANQNGLDVIITDHHSVPEIIPDTLAINPKRPGDKYPFKDLAGVGVAFKLAQALQQTRGKPEAGHEKWLLDLVALGTICDVVTLVGENRVLAKYGLKVMHKSRRAGLKALAAVAGVPLGEINSYHVGFLLGPRMNAAGRLEHAARSLELVTTGNAQRAWQIATELDQLNRQRQLDQAQIFAEADTMAQNFIDDPVLVLASENWSHGIVGIVASKLVEKWRKPTLVMQIMGDTTKGSARSTGTFNLVDGLRGVSHNFVKFGGHFFAAGYTLETAKINQLRRDLNAYYRTTIGPEEEQLSEVKVSEAELEGLGQIDWPLHAALERLEPHGNGNPKPIFATTGLKVVNIHKVGKEKTHLKLRLADQSGNLVEAIGFGLAEKHPNLKEGQLVDVCFQVAKNEFADRVTLQLVLVDLK